MRRQSHFFSAIVGPQQEHQPMPSNHFRVLATATLDSFVFHVYIIFSSIRSEPVTFRPWGQKRIVGVRNHFPMIIMGNCHSFSSAGCREPFSILTPVFGYHFLCVHDFNLFFLKQLSEPIQNFSQKKMYRMWPFHLSFPNCCHGQEEWVNVLMSPHNHHHQCSGPPLARRISLHNPVHLPAI